MVGHADHGGSRKTCMGQADNDGFTKGRRKWFNYGSQMSRKQVTNETEMGLRGSQTREKNGPQKNGLQNRLHHGSQISKFPRSQQKVGEGGVWWGGSSCLQDPGILVSQDTKWGGVRGPPLPTRGRGGG